MTFHRRFLSVSILVILHWATLTDQSQVNEDVLDSCFEDDIFASLSKPSSPWLYENDAVNSQWNGECATGFEQSPIDIPRQGNVWQEMEDLLFDNYASSPPMMRLTNTGYGLRLDIGHCHCDSHIPTLSQGNLNGTFRFYQAHFHWGSSRSHGSEHMKSGTRFPMEVQLLHYNMKYESMKTALEQPDGLAGLVIFFQMSSDINIKMEDLVDQLPNVAHLGSSVLLNQPLPLIYLLPKYDREFYRYLGSLTSPPCVENVQWTIMRDPIPITLKQMSNFDDLFRDVGNKTKLNDNFRPIQEKNNRTIFQRLVIYNCGFQLQVSWENIFAYIIIIGQLHRYLI